jgi:DNA-binding NtrC family response regulator
MNAAVEKALLEGPSPAAVLIADDQPDVLDALRLLLKNGGYRLKSANSPSAVLDTLEQEEFDAIIMDLNYARDTTSGREGLELLDAIRQIDSTVPVIVMTAWGTIELAVDAMRRGARDFVQKPWENARLLSIVKTQVELCQAIRGRQRLAEENRLLRNDGCPPLIAESGSMKPILQVIARVAPSDANVLITGEHGTGKDVVAKTIHALSPRKDNPIVTVNVGGLSESPFESELFGHVKGAFTDARSDRIGRFEMADGGTLFLDEIANIGLAQQARLLRALESREIERVGSSRSRRVNVRVVAATNARLSEEVERGAFRADLLYRLNTIEIHLPPLRERSEDIVPLALHFMSMYRDRYRQPVEHLTSDAIDLLQRYPWPGNVRELDHAVQRAVLMAPADAIRPEDLGLASEPTSKRIESMSLDEVEALLVRKALERANGNVSHAAKALGLSRAALYRRIERHNLTED